MQIVGAGRYAFVGAIALVLSFGSGCLIDRSAIRGGIRADAAIDTSLPDEDAGSTCAPSLTACGESCVDLTSDSANCGACGAACTATQACVASSCVCGSPDVYGVCAPGLRVWLDARNPRGTGAPGDPGPLERWTNLAETDAGDALPTTGTPTLELGAGNRAVVRLDMSTLETAGAYAPSPSQHLEVMIVARARTTLPGTLLSARVTGAESALLVELPGREGATFGLPTGESQLSTPFGRDTRHTTLWHAFSGEEGTEIRVDGVTVARGSRRGPVPIAGPLLVGGSPTGEHASVDVSEILVFDRPLTEAERTSITTALLARWELGTPSAPSGAGLALWLDARQPLAGGAPTDGLGLPRWNDRSTRATVATVTSAVWRADGLSAGQPAVVLDPSSRPSHVELPRPASGDLTALVVLATEEGGGAAEGWASPCVLGADGRFAADDAALVMSGGRVGFSRELGATPVSPTRYDDGDPHLVVLRRTSDGATQLWVDHEPVVQHRGAAGSIGSPGSWWLGRHPDPSQGAIGARYGEVLVYDRALGDEELAIAERYLQRRWSTPLAGRQRPLEPCSPGSHLACPVRSLAELRALPAGRYWLDVGSGPSRVSVDDAEGGGWVLVLQYVRAAGQNPDLSVIAPGWDWPATSPTALGGGDPVRSDRWGHVGAEVARALEGASELRWYGATTAIPSIIHFSSPVGVDAWRRGLNEFSGIPAMHTRLTGATASLPGTANSFGYLQGPDTVLTAFPFFQLAATHWAIRGVGYRWSVDDFDNGFTPATIHRVWVR